MINEFNREVEMKKSNDFEVMPLGTIEEITEMRKLSNELINAQSHQQILEIISKIRQFYAYHVEKYPIVI
jgi:tRNA-binding EMAP/Myf-like protein